MKKTEEISYYRVGKFLDRFFMKYSENGKIELFWNLLDRDFADFLASCGDNVAPNLTQYQKAKIINIIRWWCKNEDKFNTAFKTKVANLKYEKKETGVYLITFTPFVYEITIDEYDDKLKLIENPIRLNGNFYLDFLNTANPKSKFLENGQCEEGQYKQFTLNVKVYNSNPEIGLICFSYGDNGIHCFIADTNKGIRKDFLKISFDNLRNKTLSEIGE